MMKQSGIHITQSHAGDFTAWCKEHGFGSPQEGAAHVMANKSKYSAHVVEMANFAKNAKKWRHKHGAHSGHRAKV